MDEQNQIIKLCRVCENQRDSDDYHRIFKRCEICTAKKAQNYQNHRFMLISGSKINQKNKKENRKNQKQTY